MDKVFFSKNNFNLINQIVTNEIKKYDNLDIKNKYNGLILDAMKYIHANVDNVPPKHVDKKKYLDMMNIKILSLVIPKIRNDLNNNIKIQNKSDEFVQVSEKLKKHNLEERSLNQTVNINSFGNLPLPINQYKNDKINEKFEELNESRLSENKSKFMASDNDKKIMDLSMPLEESKNEYDRMVRERGLDKIKVSYKENDNGEDRKEQSDEYYPDILYNIGDEDKKTETLIAHNKKDINNFSLNNNNLDNNSNRVNNNQNNPNNNYNPNNINNISNIILPNKQKYIEKE